jgi:hypothetical protein
MPENEQSLNDDSAYYKLDCHLERRGGLQEAVCYFKADRLLIETRVRVPQPKTAPRVSRPGDSIAMSTVTLSVSFSQLIGIELVDNFFTSFSALPYTNIIIKYNSVKEIGHTREQLVLRTSPIFARELEKAIRRQMIGKFFKPMAANTGRAIFFEDSRLETLRTLNNLHIDAFLVEKGRVEERLVNTSPAFLGIIGIK